MSSTSSQSSKRRADIWSTTDHGFERLFGDSEAAFYPASKAGLGDMFLHLAFRAPAEAMNNNRLAIAWAIIRKRHPLLQCKVVSGDSTNDVPHLVFTPSTDADGALEEAKSALYFNHKSKDELIFEHMNGPRALSDDHLSHLIISTSPLATTTASTTASTSTSTPASNAMAEETSTPVNVVPSQSNSNSDEVSRELAQGSSEEVDPDESGCDYDLLMCAPHFLGDGTSLHQATHDLFALLASPFKVAQLKEELIQDVDWLTVLPPAFESRMEVPTSRFAKAVSKVDFIRSLNMEIGGHTLPRNQHGPQRTVLHEVAFSESETAQILKKCKQNGVTVNHAVVALCDVVWARTMGKEKGKEMPLMMYTAMNLRPYLSPFPLALPNPVSQEPVQLHPGSAVQSPPQPPPPTYWFVALTYFNIVLPSFLPSIPSVLWERARSVKAQIRRTVFSPFLKTRALEMGGIRVGRALGRNTASLPTFQELVGSASTPNSLPPAPSAALLGLSLIGNLDSTYTRSSYPTFYLHSVTTASRQKPGGMLLLEHTFGKKLWLHLCWDENGFEQGSVEEFWRELEVGVREFLV